jgi:DNA-binding transcriptional ArsR family regulator
MPITLAVLPKKAKNASRDESLRGLPDEVSEAIVEIGGLDKLSSSIPRPLEIAAESELHHILSDRTRLTILYAIGSCEMCPCILKEYLKISDSRLSYHLSVLEEHGLVVSHSKKNWRVFSITDAGKTALATRHSREA